MHDPDLTLLHPNPADALTRDSLRQARATIAAQAEQIKRLRSALVQCRADYCISKVEVGGILNACRTFEERYAASVRLDSIKARLGVINLALSTKD